MKVLRREEGESWPECIGRLVDDAGGDVESALLHFRDETDEGAGWEDAAWFTAQEFGVLEEIDCDDFFDSVPF